MMALLPAAHPRRRRRRRQHRPSLTLHLSVFRSLHWPPQRDWASLPPGIISSIFHKLDLVQIMFCADKVCRSWRRASREEPGLWRRIHIRDHVDLAERGLAYLDDMAKDALERSQGQCQAFTAEGRGVRGHDFLQVLVDNAPFLKSFALVSCGGISQHIFLKAIKSFPLLEELEVTNCFFYHGDSMKVVAKACPRLKHLKLCHPPNCSSDREDADDSEALGIARMHELRSLMLVHGELTNKGLAAIIDNCRHLESLDIRRCPHIIIDDALRAKWPRINTVDAPLYFDERGRVDDYYHECRLCSDYFDSGCWGTSHEFNNEESTVVVTVRELRSVELYRNDLTNHRRRAILAKCPQLEFNDIRNCRDILLNNAMQAMSAQIKLESQGIRNWRRHGDCSSIKTNKLTAKLLRNCSDCETFNPEGLDMRNCRDIIMSMGLKANYDQITLRKKIKNYHHRTKYLMEKLTKEMVRNQPIDSSKDREFYRQELESDNLIVVQLPGSGYHYAEFDHQKFVPDTAIECSTCLMFEYFAQRWEILGIDEYDDYYDPSFGLDSHDETDFQFQDRMLGKRLRRYLKIERQCY